MINGAHSIIYSSKPDSDRAFLRDVLKLPSVDVGGGWLIFGLPPAEVAVHPSDSDGTHELYLMCDDINAFVAAMGSHDVACSPVLNRGWGLLVELRLPGGGNLGVYQPRHARPKSLEVRKTAAKKTTLKSTKSAARKGAKATTRKSAKTTKTAKPSARRPTKSSRKAPAKKAHRR